MGSLSLLFSDIEFVAFKPEHYDKENKLKLNIRVQRGGIQVSGHIEDMVHLMLAAVLGEYDYAIYIGGISFVDEFEEEHENADCIISLPHVVDLWRQNPKET